MRMSHQSIKLPVRNETDVYINLKTCQITVVCLIKHFTCHRFLSKILKLRERFAFIRVVSLPFLQNKAKLERPLICI